MKTDAKCAPEVTRIWSGWCQIVAMSLTYHWSRILILGMSIRTVSNVQGCIIAKESMNVHIRNVHVHRLPIVRKFITQPIEKNETDVNTMMTCGSLCFDWHRTISLCSMKFSQLRNWMYCMKCYSMDSCRWYHTMITETYEMHRLD